MRMLLWVIAAFWAGSLPFSFWVGRLALRTDIRGYGDGNPGAANVMRAGGRGWGALAVLLDYLKGAIPVGLAHFLAGLSGGTLAAVALAPVLGHAFSPFLRFRGGKAVTVTFGAWTGLTLWAGPTSLGVGLCVGYALLAVDGWSVIAALLGLAAYLVLAGAAPTLWPTWLGNTLLLAWTHRRDLAQPPRWRPWVRGRDRREDK